MRIGSLFAGIGGFDLAAEWMGWETIWQSEIDPHCQAWLRDLFPWARQLGDITAIDWSTVERPDILTGGFPCQPHSFAGKRGGRSDARDLWPEYRRAIRLLRPDYVVGENVPGLVTSDNGNMFGGILADLAALGYDAEWHHLSAAECGAFHERNRIWILAYPQGQRFGEARRLRRERAAERIAGRRETVGDADASGRPSLARPELGQLAGRCATLGDADNERRQECDPAALATAARRRGGRSGPLRWDDWRPVTGDDGVTRYLPGPAAARGPESPLWPFTDGVPGRMARLRGIGNAICPAACYDGPYRRIAELDASA